MFELLVYAVAFILTAIATAREDRRISAELREDSRLSVMRLFRAVGRELDLGFLHSAPERNASLRGRIDGVEVTATGRARPPGGGVTSASATVAAPTLAEIQLRSRWRPAASPLRGDALLGNSPIDTGDPSFDALIEVDGPALTARAVLTGAVRNALMALARRGTVRLRGGHLDYELLERVWSTNALVALIREVVSAARAFPAVADVPAALADLSRNDPVPSVRARCLTALLAERPDQPETKAAVDTALADPSDAVRVVAATALGERGVAVLREVAMRKDSEQEPAARSIKLLGRRLSSSEVVAILDSAVSAKRHVVALAAIESLARARDVRACRLLQVVLQGDDDNLAVAAANALGAMPAAEAEQALVAGLTRPSPDVRQAAVRALGRVGGLSTIAHLCTLIEGSALFPEVVRLAQQAIAAIQARLPGAAPGQISLVDSDAAGQLTLAQDRESGRLSIAKE